MDPEYDARLPAFEALPQAERDRLNEEGLRDYLCENRLWKRHEQLRWYRTHGLPLTCDGVRFLLLLYSALEVTDAHSHHLIARIAGRTRWRSRKRGAGCRNLAEHPTRRKLLVLRRLTPAVSAARLVLALVAAGLWMATSSSGLRPAAAAPAPPVAPAASGVASAVIPFQYDPLLMPYATVRATLNGQEFGPFLIDTGTAAGLVLDRRIATQLQLKPTGDKVAFRLGSATSEVVRLQSFQLGTGEGSVRSKDLLAVLGDLRSMALGGPPVAGIIGWPALSQRSGRLDFARRTLELTPVGEFTPPAPGTPAAKFPGIMVELPLSGGTPRRVQCMVDSGSMFSIFPPEVVAGLKPKGRASLIRSGFSGMDVGEEVLVPELDFAGVTLRDVPVSVANAAELPRLGTDLLSRFTLQWTRDPYVWIFHPRPDVAPRLAGYSGIIVEKREQEAIARIVQPGSPAAQSGVQEGDRLQSIDGRSPADLPRNAVQRLLDGLEGTTAKVELARPTGPVQVSLSRSSRFQVPLVPLVGATFRVRPNEPFRVSALRADSPAVAAGLQVEDEILAINGLSTLTTPPAQFSLELRRPTVVVTLKRKGIEQPLELTLVARKQ